MTVYVVGDIQGCYRELKDLLKSAQFRPHVDDLYCVGDLINRGPDSLGVLHFLMDLPKPAHIVLGNHDVHLLRLVYGETATQPGDTLDAVLAAPDLEALCDFLLNQRVMIDEPMYDMVVVHAGIYPLWHLHAAKGYADELEIQLRKKNKQFYRQLYGDSQHPWSNQLTSMKRWRFIANACFCMRFCDRGGALYLPKKHKFDRKIKKIFPWFELPGRIPIQPNIIFGHWSTLKGKTGKPRLYATDRGCVWGGELAALNVENKTWIAIQSTQTRKI